MLAVLEPPGHDYRANQKEDRDQAGDHHSDPAQVVIVRKHAAALHGDGDDRAIAARLHAADQVFFFQRGLGARRSDQGPVRQRHAGKAGKNAAFWRHLRQQQAGPQQRGQHRGAARRQPAHAQQPSVGVQDLHDIEHDFGFRCRGGGDRVARDERMTCVGAQRLPVRIDDRHFPDWAGCKDRLAQEFHMRRLTGVDFACGQVVEAEHGLADHQFRDAGRPVGGDGDFRLTLALQP